MQYKHPQLHFLNDIPKPTLADLIDQTSSSASPHQDALFLLSEIILYEQAWDYDAAQLKQSVSLPCFSLFCAFQVLGSATNGGWALGLFEQLPQLVLYTELALAETGYPELAYEVKQLIECFPPEVVFLANSDDYTDALNFMENPKRATINNAKLNAYSKEQRQSFNKSYNTALDSIETRQLACYGENYYETLWQPLFAYYDQHLTQSIWRA